jgi:hypothetical protein
LAARRYRCREANRRNARKSTGPRSPAGKAAVGLNNMMGGYGSGWQGAKKVTVESSLVRRLLGLDL